MSLGHSRAEEENALSQKATTRQAGKAVISPIFFHKGPNILQCLPRLVGEISR
jgi:hypothetical protein